MLPYKVLHSSVELPEVPGDFKQKSFATIHEVLAVVLSNGWFSQKTPLPLPEEKIYRVLLHNIAQPLSLCAHRGQ
jgi:hypothetical protein